VESIGGACCRSNPASSIGGTGLRLRLRPRGKSLRLGENVPPIGCNNILSEILWLPETEDYSPTSSKRDS